jgi:hypothetical protein
VEFTPAETYLRDQDAAASYLTRRTADAAALLTQMQWAPGPVAGTLQCRIYGHSALWDMQGTTLHAFHTDLEVMLDGEDDIELCNRQQLLAYLLARHW